MHQNVRSGDEHQPVDASLLLRVHQPGVARAAQAMRKAMESPVRIEQIGHGQRDVAASDGASVRTDVRTDPAGLLSRPAPRPREEPHSSHELVDFRDRNRVRIQQRHRIWPDATGEDSGDRRARSVYAPQSGRNRAEISTPPRDAGTLQKRSVSCAAATRCEPRAGPARRDAALVARAGMAARGNGAARCRPATPCRETGATCATSLECRTESNRCRLELRGSTY